MGLYLQTTKYIAIERLENPSLPMYWAVGILGTQDCRLPGLCDGLAEGKRRQPHS